MRSVNLLPLPSSVYLTVTFAASGASIGISMGRRADAGPLCTPGDRSRSESLQVCERNPVTVSMAEGANRKEADHEE